MLSATSDGYYQSGSYTPLAHLIMTMLPFFLPTYGEATALSGLLAITTSAVIVWKLRGFKR